MFKSFNIVEPNNPLSGSTLLKYFVSKNLNTEICLQHLAFNIKLNKI